MFIRVPKNVRLMGTKILGIFECAKCLIKIFFYARLFFTAISLIISLTFLSINIFNILFILSF